MSYIKIISFKKGDDRRIVSLEEEYLIRLKSNINIDIIDLKSLKVKFDKPLAVADIGNILKKFPNYKIVLLSEWGRQFSSMEFADFISENFLINNGNIIFLIAAAAGFTQEVLDGEYEKIAISKMTFPHRIARFLLIEALYRSFDILNNGNYHK